MTRDRKCQSEKQIQLGFSLRVVLTNFLCYQLVLKARRYPARRIRGVIN